MLGIVISTIVKDGGEMELKIVNEKGLHARASAKFAEVCENSPAEVWVLYDGMSANGASIMGLMMLGAAKGAVLEIDARGDGADQVLVALQALVEDYFGEGG